MVASLSCHHLLQWMFCNCKLIWMFTMPQANAAIPNSLHQRITWKYLWNWPLETWPMHDFTFRYSINNPIQKGDREKKWKWVHQWCCQPPFHRLLASFFWIPSSNHVQNLFDFSIHLQVFLLHVYYQTPFGWSFQALSMHPSAQPFFQ